MLRERIADTAGEPSRMAPENIEPFVKAEIAKWAEVVKLAGIKGRIAVASPVSQGRQLFWPA